MSNLRRLTIEKYHKTEDLLDKSYADYVEYEDIYSKIMKIFSALAPGQKQIIKSLDQARLDKALEADSFLDGLSSGFCTLSALLAVCANHDLVLTMTQKLVEIVPYASQVLNGLPIVMVYELLNQVHFHEQLVSDFESCKFLISECIRPTGYPNVLEYFRVFDAERGDQMGVGLMKNNYNKFRNCFAVARASQI